MKQELPELRLRLFRELRYFTIFSGQTAELHSDTCYYLKRAQLPTSTHNEAVRRLRTHRPAQRTQLSMA